ncbi:MAG: hypothetical protein HGA45_15695 [Chloroflexales bacterium]|nr:hypothetical protein [Chloroflexales bacterium]
MDGRTDHIPASGVLNGDVAGLGASKANYRSPSNEVLAMEGPEGERDARLDWGRVIARSAGGHNQVRELARTRPVRGRKRGLKRRFNVIAG